MNLLKRILRLFGVVVHVEQDGVCVVCGQGPNPALGVPVPTTDGTWKHLLCMVVGRQIGDAADKDKAQRVAPAAQAQQPNPTIVGIVRPAGRENWN